jgi:hypothetical protein
MTQMLPVFSIFLAAQLRHVCIRKQAGNGLVDKAGFVIKGSVFRRLRSRPRSKPIDRWYLMIEVIEILTGRISSMVMTCQ